MGESKRAPLIIRGEIIHGDVEFFGRRGGASFLTANVQDYVDRLTIATPSALADLYTLSFDDILDYLVRLGERLKFEKNRHMEEAFELSKDTSGLSPSILLNQYRGLPLLFGRDVLRRTVESSIGIDAIEGWVPQALEPSSPTQVKVRAFGARAVHIIAGNAPLVGVTTIVRNALTRSDAIIKTPSNDPLTAVAVARTMIEMEPDHPLTSHLSVAYWKGGDEAVEAALFDPRKIEKIVAWGGFASIKHVTKYLQPGLELIALDPKHSATIIGREAFETDEILQSVAARIALDVGSLNQEACVNARVVYVESGIDAPGLARANKLGDLVFKSIQALPASISTPHKAFDPGLRQEIDGLRYAEDDYRVIGGKGAEGAVIVSQTDAPVDFAPLLSCRVANIVPIDDLDVAVRSTNAYTQTIGLYPESLKTRLRDRLAFHGAQRLVSLGSAVPIIVRSGPQDGIEPMRRMCKWITDETTEGSTLLQMAQPSETVHSS